MSLYISKILKFKVKNKTIQNLLERQENFENLLGVFKTDTA